MPVAGCPRGCGGERDQAVGLLEPVSAFALFPRMRACSLSSSALEEMGSDVRSRRDDWSSSCINSAACTAQLKRAVQRCRRPVRRVSTAAGWLPFVRVRGRSAIDSRKHRRLPRGGHMRRDRSGDIERTIAHCRVILSVAALVTVYVDPTRPTLTRWMPLTGGPFTLDPLALAVMIAHLVYSVAIDVVLRSRVVSATQIATASTWADVLFGGAIALVTEGANSPFYVFFAFAVLAAGFRAGLRFTVKVTVASVALYLSLILVTQ